MLQLIAISNSDPGPNDFFSWRFLELVASNLAPGVVPALVALAAGLVLTPAAIWTARRTGFLSRPNRERDIHTRPIPYGGGLAMFGAIMPEPLAMAPTRAVWSPSENSTTTSLGRVSVVRMARAATICASSAANGAACRFPAPCRAARS